MRDGQWSAARRRSASSLAVWGGGGPGRAILAPSPGGVGPRTRIAPTGSSRAGRACSMVVCAGRWPGLPLGLVFKVLDLTKFKVNRAYRRLYRRCASKRGRPRAKASSWPIAKHHYPMRRGLP